MALTEHQIREVIQVLSASHLDRKLINEVQRILEKNSGLHDEPSTTYDAIKGYCANYRDTMSTYSKMLTPPQPYARDMMLVYMDHDKVARVLDNVPTDGYLAAVMGIYSNSRSLQQLTVSLLATDSNFNFVTDGSGNILPGEQSWREFNILENFDEVFEQ
jgi:hypothetical protein